MKKFFNVFRNFVLVFCILVFSLFLTGCDNQEKSKDTENTDFEMSFEDRINSQIENMTLEEKVGQLFIIRPESLGVKDNDKVNDSYNYGDYEITEDMKNFYSSYPCGGIILFAKNIDNADQVKKFTEDIHGLNSNVRVLTCIDEEGGRVARLARTESLNLDNVGSMEELAKSGLEATKNAGIYISSYLKEYGFDVDFAPVADVNTNPNNVVIGDRSFGSDPEVVKEYVLAYLEGLKENNIEGCIKHFPGHGDTVNDTHSGYTEILKTWEDLEKCELITFKEGIKNGVKMIMTAHIALPNVTGNKLPSTLSSDILTSKLRGELNYDGIIITDALNMGAIHNDYSSSESAVLAFNAGADILLMPYDYKEAFDGVVNAVKDGTISEERLNESLFRILKFKAEL